MGVTAHLLPHGSWPRAGTPKNTAAALGLLCVNVHDRCCSEEPGFGGARDEPRAARRPCRPREMMGSTSSLWIDGLFLTQHLPGPPRGPALGGQQGKHRDGRAGPLPHSGVEALRRPREAGEGRWQHARPGSVASGVTHPALAWPDSWSPPPSVAGGAPQRTSGRPPAVVFGAVCRVCVRTFPPLLA